MVLSARPPLTLLPVGGGLGRPGGEWGNLRPACCPLGTWSSHKSPHPGSSSQPRARVPARPPRGSLRGPEWLAAAPRDSQQLKPGAVSLGRAPWTHVLVLPVQSGCACAGSSCPLGGELPGLRPAAVDRAGAWTARWPQGSGDGQVRSRACRICRHKAAEGPRPRPCKPRVDLKAAWTEAGLGAAGCRCFQQGDHVTVTSAECSGPSGLQVPLSGTPHSRCCTSHITHTSLRRLWGDPVRGPEL